MKKPGFFYIWYIPGARPNFKLTKNSYVVNWNSDERLLLHSSNDQILKWRKLMVTDQCLDIILQRSFPGVPNNRMCLKKRPRHDKNRFQHYVPNQIKTQSYQFQ